MVLSLDLRLPAAGTLNTVLPVLEAMASGRRQGRLALMSSVSTTVTGAVEFAGGREVLMAQEAAAAVALGASHQGSTGYSPVVGLAN